MKKLTALFWRCYHNSVLRYIFFGGLTTLVNLVSFYLLRSVAGFPPAGANLISIILAVLFAYVVNARYVFEKKSDTWKEHLEQFGRFIGARAVTMVVEVVGVWLTVQVGNLPDMWGKFLTQFLVLVLNYLFSRFLYLRIPGANIPNLPEPDKGGLWGLPEQEQQSAEPFS